MLRNTKKVWSKLAICLVVVFMCVGGALQYFGAAHTYAAYTSSKADPLTVDNYKETFKQNTDTVGRIWTDKSVSTGEGITVNGQNVKKDPNADFQVALSALASSGKLTSEKVTPVDITLLLDVSTSMKREYDTTRYEATYLVDEMLQTGEINKNTLFVHIDGEYIPVHREEAGKRKYYYMNAQGEKVYFTPKKNENQKDAVQTYCYRARLHELRDSARKFVQLVTEENKKIDDPKLKHRISVVSFTGDATIDREFTVPVHDGSKNDIEEYVGTIPLRPQGETATHLAMQQAVELDKVTRKDAKKIVILFTDGKPHYKQGTQNPFVEPSTIVVEHAQKLKDAKAEIYSIGMFDKETTEKEGMVEFMETVSSYYPKAKLIPTKDYKSFTVEGEKDPKGAKYAQTVKEGTSLENIFIGIFGEITANSGYATEVELGRPDSSGYVTITDPLGEYMDFRGFDGLVFRDKVYKNPTKSVNGKIETYVFEGEISTKLTEKTNLNKIIITVDKTNAYQQVVSVKVPASVIPVYWYEIMSKNDKATCEVVPDLPIRLLYSVGLNQDIENEILSGNMSKELMAYVESHKDADGKVNFYSNDYDPKAIPEGGTGTYAKAKTVATFIPSEFNNFYTYSQDNPVFTDKDCKVPLKKQPVVGETYYIQWQYFDMTSQVPKLITKSISFVEKEEYQEHYMMVDGTVHVKKGTHRQQQVRNANKNKVENTTNTVKYSIYPNWNTQASQGKQVDVWLGNNGLLQFELPGSLEISKDVVNTVTPENINKDQFQFKVEFKNAEGQTLNNAFFAKIVNADSSVMKPQEGETYTIQSGDTFTLSHGQKLIVNGLPKDVNYSVTETTSPDYYSTTVKQGQKDAVEDKTATGVIPSEGHDTVVFTNTYHVKDVVLPGKTHLNVKKVLTGRHMNVNDTFTFEIKGDQPLPKETVLTLKGVDSKDTVTGAFGDITYHEKGVYHYTIVETDKNAQGIVYSQAEYKVVVTVTDDGKGQLNAIPTITQVKDDLGNQPSSPLDKMVFTNTYTPDHVQAQFKGHKTLKGDRLLGNKDFNFVLKDAKGKELQTVTNDGKGNFVFDEISYNEEGTYEYTISEVKGSIKGVTYDESVMNVKVVVTYNATKGAFEITTTYTKGKDVITDIEFANTYKALPTDVKVPVEKVLDGRQMNAKDEFTFNLMSKEGTPAYNKTLVLKGQDGQQSVLGEFETIVFDTKGEYHYTLTETKGNDKHITYSQAVYDVVVKVEDQEGQLKATTTMTQVKTDANATVNKAVEKATFTNTYTPDHVQAQFKGHKTLKGDRLLGNKDFSFVLKDVEDKELQTVTNDEKGNFVFDAISYNKEGTYEYTISEVKGSIEGVTYDESIINVKVVVTYDDVKGEFTATTTYTKGEDVITNIEFVNTYKALPVKVTLPVTKKLTGREFEGHDFFTFYIEAKNGGPVPENLDFCMINGGNETIQSFDPITFTKPGIYKYIVAESTGYPVNLIFSQAEYDVTVKVVDDNGQLKATTSIVKTITDSGEFANESTDRLVFENLFRPTPVQAQFKGHKTLKGDRLLGNKDFSFVLKDAEDKELQTVTNDDKGNFVFKEISYNKEGTYEYTISEVEGSIKGVTYDESIMNVKVVVTKNKTTGELTATTTYTKGEDVITDIEFVNTYKALPTDVKVPVTKTLAGRQMNAKDEFTFNLMSKEGTPEYNKTLVLKGQDGQQSVLGEFEKISFTQKGEYHYTLTETKGNGKNIAYSQAEYDVTVNVVDDNGQLKATTTITLVKDDSGKTTEQVLDKATFTNTYTPDNVQVQFKGHKTLNSKTTHRELKDQEFTFVLKDKNGQDIQTVTNDGKGNIVFDAISYDCSGTYEYTIEEMIPDGKVPGMVYDQAVVKVIVTVQYDAATGLFSTEIIYEKAGQKGNTAFEFVNQYEAKPTSIALPVHKTLNGRDMNTQDTFVFKLMSQKGTTPLKQTLTLQGVDSKTSVEGSFDKITFTQEGEYRYTISEAKGKDDHITYSQATYEVVVKVVDQDGQLKATSTITQVKDDSGKTTEQVLDKAVFTNTYTPDNVQAQFKGHKTLKSSSENRVLKAGEFEFVLKDSDSTALGTVKNDAKGNFVFDAISYNKEGTYEYTISEVKGAIKSVTYDDTVVQVKVNVTYDQTKGQYVIDTTYLVNDTEVSQAQFENIYQSAPISETFDIEKKFIGRKWNQNDTFTFVLKNTGKTDGVTMPTNTQVVLTQDDITSLSDDQKVSVAKGQFLPVEFNKEGTYNFTITEVVPAVKNGIVFDQHTYAITVVVTDNGEGQLVSTVSYEGAKVFTNRYETKDVVLDGKTHLNVEKVFKGREWTTNDKFAFTLKATGHAAQNEAVIMPKDLTITLDQSLVKDGKIEGQGQDIITTVNKAFGDITFKAVDTYTFEIQEVIPEDKNGIAYDQHKAIITVVVTDNSKGYLEAAVSSVTEGSLVFTNTYTAKAVKVNLEGQKTLNVINGNRELKDKEFAFRLTDEQGNVLNTVKNNAQGKIAFPEMSYDHAGTFVYYIQEIIPDTKAPGMTYDEGQVKVTVTVTYDQKTGQLSANTTYVKDEAQEQDDFTFMNEYKAAPTPAVQDFKVMKYVKATEGNQYKCVGGEFDFKLVPAKENPAGDPVKEMTVSNDQQGHVQFASKDQFVYTTPGTYKYTINEVSGKVPGISKYDNSIYTITVVVSDMKEDAYTGQLVAQVSIEKEGQAVDEMSFTNEYNPGVATYTVKGQKVLKVIHSDKELQAEQFNFVLVDENNQILETVKNDAKGQFAFTSLTFDQPGQYKYMVKELNDGVHGFTYDDTVYTVIVDVKDEGGQLVATAVVENDKDIVFNNTYEPSSTQVVFDAMKTMEGRPLNDGEFTFELVNKENPDDVLQVKKNDADGHVVFDAIPYLEEGEYKYIIREQKGELGGVIYDQSSYDVTVTVVDTNGQLVATTTYAGNAGEIDEVQFNNSYKAAPTTVKLGASKTLNGRPLKANEFEFALLDAEGQELQVVRNDKDGVITFDELVFEEENEVVYKVVEKAGDENHMTYDRSQYIVTITVTDNEMGSLVPNVVITKDGQEVEGIGFINTFDQPTVPEKPENPSTGDTQPIAGYGFAAIASLAVASVVRRKKRDNA